MNTWDSWERFNETCLPDKESFYRELNKEDITDEEYAHAQKVWNAFKIKNLGEYHDLYVQSDTCLKKLSVGEFEWVQPEEYTEDLIKKYDENDDYGAILEVDVDYPRHLRKLHSDLPFLPERIKINKVEKLICNTQNKRNYIVHY